MCLLLEQRNDESIQKEAILLVRNPKSIITFNQKKKKKIIRENSEIYQVYISILNINSKRVFYKKKEVKRVPVDQNLESIEC